MRADLRYNEVMDVQGFPPQAPEPVLTSSSSATKSQSKWYYNIWFVLLMLFFVLGPFGLPLVWKNQKFSRWVKIALTIITIVYTLLLIGMTARMARAVMEELRQFNSTLQF